MLLASTITVRSVGRSAAVSATAVANASQLARRATS
jgi:hypothetical protein